MNGTIGTRTGRRFRRRRGRRGARIALAVALVAAAPLVGRLDPAGAHPTGIVSVTDDLPAGHTLAAGDVEVVGVPADTAPDGAVTTADEAVGARLTGAVRRGELLTDAGLDGPDGTPGTHADLRVVPVPLADPSVADLLTTGDLVDLVGPDDPGVPTGPEPVVRAARVAGVPDGRGGHRSLLVEVPEADAARLAATAAGTPLAVVVHG